MENHMKNRKVTQEFIIKSIDKIDKDNGKRYRDVFKKMTDKQFDDYMLSLKNNETNVFVYIPNLQKNLTNKEIVEFAKYFNVELYDYIKEINPETGQVYYKNQKYLILRLPEQKK